MGLMSVDFIEQIKEIREKYDKIYDARECVDRTCQRLNYR